MIHPGSVFGRHEFVFRRLHSLTGLVSIGGYLCFHLATNAAVLDGLDTYQRRVDSMKIFPAVHYSMGGLWCDYDRTAEGGLHVGSPRNQQTNVPGIFAIGECDYQFHGANRLGANSMVACIFSGLTVAPGVVSYVENLPQGPAAGRLDALTSQGGIQTCGNAQNCVKVCFKEIPLTTAIARAGRSATLHTLKQWFDR